MTKNPIINALAAIAYISTVASLIVYGQPIIQSLPLANAPVIFAPITILSLFVFSAAVMGYLFLYEPLLLILAGEKKQGTALFLKTVAAFGIGAALFVLAGVLLTSIL